MTLTESGMERAEGDLLARRRKVDAILQGGTPEHPGPEWHFGPLTVGEHPAEGFLKVHSPDGDLWEVDYREFEDPDRVEAVEAELRACWEEWLDAL